MIGTPVPPDVAAKWQTDPNTVTIADLDSYSVAAENHFRKFHTVEGVLWQAWRTDASLTDPDRYGSGGDSLLFTGMYLSASTYRFRVTNKAEDLDKMIETLRGLYILTNAMGVPGNLARCAFPADKPDKWAFPGAWGGRIQDGFVYEDTTAADDPFNPTLKLPKMVYYTRVSRDQVSGLFFGLATFSRFTDPNDPGIMALDPDVKARLVIARTIAADMVERIWHKFKTDDFLIRDHTGRNNTADSISGLLKLEIVAVRRSFNPAVQKDYEKEFESFFCPFGHLGDLFNGFSNLNQYYAWNLRFCRSYSIYVLETDHDRQKKIADYIESNLFDDVEDHKNPFFIYVNNIAHPNKPAKLYDAEYALKALTIRPLRNYDSPLAKDGSPTSGTWGKILRAIGAIPHYLGITEVTPPQFREPCTYFNWQDDPWDTGYKGNPAIEEDCGLGFLLPYWMGKFYGFVK